MKVKILGDVCIDRNRVEGAEYEFYGGPGMYINLILSKFSDVHTEIITNHSEEFSKYSKSIDLYPKEPNVEKNLVYKNIVENGHRTQFAENRRDSKLNIEPSKLKDVLADADVFIFTPLMPMDLGYVSEVMESLPEKSIKLVLPQGYFRKFDEDNKVSFREFEESEEIMKMFDYVVLSKEDYPEIIELSKDWSEKFKIKTLITLDREGACIFEDGKRSDVATTPVGTIKDSTGSGDIFSGSFIYYRALGNDDETSIKFANRIAGKCLEYTPSEIAELTLQDLLT